MPVVVAVNKSLKKGVSKSPIEEGKFIERFGLEGDAHGGVWHRQVSLLAQESIDKIQLKSKAVLTAGIFAENITTKGIELHKLAVGTRLRISGAEFEVTQIGKECHGRCSVYDAAGDCIMPREGIFARVLKGGTVKKGDEIEIIEMKFNNGVEEAI